MSRYISQGWWFDGNGKIVKSGTVTVYLAGTSTLASIYTASSGGTAVNSVSASATDGSWSFYVDTDDYTRTQKFKIVFSKSGFTSKTIDNVVIFPEPGLLSWVNVKDHGAVGDGVTDDTAAIQEAIDSLSGDPGVIYLPSGTYLVASTLAISGHRQGLIGDGRNITTILFNPTAADTCIEINSGTASAIVENFIKSLTISGSGSTYVLKGITIENTEEMVIEEIDIVSMTDATAACVGIQSYGKHMFVMRKTSISADTPIQISENPHKLTEGNIDCDHYHFSDLYLIAGDDNYCLLFDDKVNVTNFNLDGYNAFIGGKSAIYWVESTSDTVTSANISFNNIRYEQETDSASYMVDIQSDDAIYNMTIRNFYGGATAKGFRFDNVVNLLLDSCQYIQANVALTLGATCRPTTLTNCFFQSSSTLSINAALTKIFDSGIGSSGTTIGQLVIYDIPSFGAISTGDIWPVTDDTYYLGKNSISTPYAFKGLIVKDTTNGNYYRIEVISGSIAATQIT